MSQTTQATTNVNTTTANTQPKGENQEVTTSETPSTFLSFSPSKLYASFLEFSDEQRITRLQSNCENQLHATYKKQCLKKNKKLKKLNDEKKEECLDLIHNVWSCRAASLGCGQELNILNICRDRDKNNCAKFERSVGTCVKQKFKELEERMDERKQK